ncbi:hypothetical protein GSI_13239 [Ganoderma sinense ZZ0214-1]|uniref:FTP domain-containing protein n=1 Tax=Ganoderma sinense ZZ0214-1 TaxID=1077348 RepID=A0A2G8RV11_9APHY|nr:hypothetical protein GSI_13239 [Ganoderma sinense ZZ0214-1]
MRHLFRVAAVAAAAAGLASALWHGSPHTFFRRKILGFGPVLSHSFFHTNPVCPRAEEPFKVAQIFVEGLIGDIPGSSSYQIRKDSTYTDQATGVTYIYARQYMDGIEVADGDINLNVKDGVVLSYGGSFFRSQKGASPWHAVARDIAPHANYCPGLERVVGELEKVDVSRPDHGVDREALGQLGGLYDWNCQFVDLPDLMAESPDVASAEDAEADDLTRALLQFMIAATPSKDRSAEMLANTAKYLSEMRATFEDPVTGFHARTFTVDHVPDAVSPVKGCLTFAQVPNGDEVTLSLIWKFEVEMEYNHWYEVVISAGAPHRIISVVDWVSDTLVPVAPIPLKDQEGEAYNVFA